VNGNLQEPILDIADKVVYTGWIWRSSTSSLFRTYLEMHGSSAEEQYLVDALYIFLIRAIVL
jgi:hypothetical protein